MARELPIQKHPSPGGADAPGGPMGGVLSPRRNAERRALRRARDADRAAEQTDQQFDAAAEPVEQSGFAQEQQRVETARERRRSAPAKQRRQYHRQRQQQLRQARHEAALGDPSAQLRHGAQVASEDFMDSVSKSGLVQPGLTKPQQRQEMSELHKAYTAMMVMQAITPLQRGLSIENVSSSVGMSATMMVLSPNFRQFTVDQGREAFSQMMENRKTKRGEKAQARLEKFYDRKGSLDSEDFSNPMTKRRLDKWQRRYERFQHQQRGHRDPFTPESAAMVEIGLAENAYHRMREPGLSSAEIDEISESHSQALGVLYDYVEADGLEPSEVSASMRQIVGRRMESEPGLRTVFSEMAQGHYVRGDPQQVYLAGTGEQVTAWTGDFYDVTSGKNITGGSFSVRKPQSPQSHMNTMSETMWGEMAEAKTVGEFNDVIDGYMVGSVVRSYPDAVDMIEDSSVRDRMGRARTMFDSMDADGLSAADQHELYTATVVNAIVEAGEKNPEVAQAWNERFGDDWDDRVTAQVQEYIAMGEEAAQAPSRSQQAEALGSEPAAGDAELDPLDARTAAEDVRYYGVDDHGLPTFAHEDHWTFGAAEAMQDDLSAHLHRAYERGGIEGFTSTAEQIRLSAVASDGSELSSGVRSWFREVAAISDSEQMGSGTARSIYGFSTANAMEQVAAEHPEIGEYMTDMKGPEWMIDERYRTELPGTFIYPDVPAGADAEQRDRILVSAMSETMSADAAVAEASHGSSAKKRTGAIAVSLNEYITGEPTGELEDQDFGMRHSRIEHMDHAMHQAGISDPEARRALYATALAHSAESVAQRSNAGEQAVSNVFGEGNWQQKAFQRVLGTDFSSAESEMYATRKERLALAGSDTAHARARERISEAAATPTASPDQYAREVAANRAQQRAATRDNKHHNEIEVSSGRWEGADYGDDEPQLG